MVVFLTVYSLVLPAVTLTGDAATEDPGINTSETTNVAEVEKLSLNEETSSDAEIETTEQAEEDVQKEEVKEEKTVIENVSYPAVSFSDSLGDMIVYVEAPEGAFPENTQMQLKEVEDEAALVDSINSNLENKEVKAIKAVDITFIYNNEEFEPLKPIKVSMTSSFIESNKEDEQLLVHVDNDNNTNIVETTEVKEKDVEAINNVEEVQTLVENTDEINEITTDNTVAFESDAFSVYAVVYTVDFEYEVDGKTYDLSIQGGESISLSKLISALNILEGTPFASVTDFLTRVKNVEFSNTEYVKVIPVTSNSYVGNIEDTVFDLDSVTGTFREGGDEAVFAPDWLIVSVAPFKTNETLKIFMRDGYVLEVQVTDDQFDNLASFVTDAQLTIDGTTYGKNDVWNVYPDVPYTMKLNFAEKNSRQFPKGGDTVVMDIPAGLNIPEGSSGTFDIPAGLAGTIKGNTWRVENGKFYITFGNDPDDILTRSSTARFELSFTATFGENADVLHFNDNVHPDVNINNDSDVSISKSGSYNPATGKMDYVVTVKSTGKSDNVKVTDIISGDALTLDQNSITIEPANTQMVSGDGNESTDNKGFVRTIAHMNHGQTVTIKYSADIDTSYLGDDFKITDASTNGKNTVKVENDDGKKDEKDFVYDNEIKYSNISKSNTNVEDDEENEKTTLEWTITANNNFNGSIVGGKISDTISYNSKDAMAYSSDPLTIHLVAKDKNGNIKAERDVTVDVTANSNGQQHWEYTIPQIENENEILSYELTYTTVVDKTKLSGSGVVTNETNNDHGGSTTGTGVVPGIEGGDTPGGDDGITAVKNAKTVTDEYIDWDIVIVVPPEGFKSLKVTDDLPYTNSGEGYRDTLEGEPSVLGLLDEETYDWNLSYSNDAYIKRDGEPLLREIVNMEFSYTDESGTHKGLKGTGSTRTVTITIRTKNDSLWVEKGTTESYYSSHVNNAKVNGHNINATGQPVKGKVVKTGKVGEETLPGSENKTKVFKYDVMLTGITEEPVVLNDYFDTEYLEFVNPDDFSDQQNFYIEWGTQTYSNDHSDKNLPAFSLVDADGNPASGDAIDHLHIEASNLKKTEEGSYYPYYHIRYWLKIKDSKIEDLTNAAISNKGSTSIGNTVKWGDLEDKTDVDFDVPVIEKNGWFTDTVISGYNNRMFDFAIDINKAEHKINNGQPMELTDTHTSNVSVEYNTVKAYKVKDPTIDSNEYKTVQGLIEKAKTQTLESWEQNKIDKFNNGVENAPEVYWNFDGNIGAFSGIDDETHYLIVYSALIIGSNAQEFSNEADMEGFISTKSAWRDFGNDSGGAAEVYQIGLLKHMKGKTSEGLAGTTFQLFRGTGTFHEVTKDGQTWMEEDRVPMTWGEGTETVGKVGQNITFTTGSDGYVKIALDQTRHGAELEENVHYFLKEIDSPPGYMIDSSVEYWEFTLTQDPDQVVYGTKRDEYGNRIWIYFYYDDILRMTNVPTTDPLTVKVDKKWLGIDGNPLDMTSDENKSLVAKVQLYQKVDDAEYVAVETIKNQDGTKEFEGSVTLNNENSWKYTWEDLPRDDGVHKYAYKLEEIEYPGVFASTVNESETETVKTYEITNQKVAENNVKVTVSKAWKNEDGQSNLTDNLPDKVDFFLYRVVSREPFSYTPVSGGNKYTIVGNQYLVTDEDEEGLYRITKEKYQKGISFENLPSTEKREDGNWYFYSYYVKERPMEGFTSSLSISKTQDESNTNILVETLTNTKLPEPVDLKIRKVWTDETGDEIAAPDKEITFKLYQVTSSQPFTTLPTSGGTLYNYDGINSTVSNYITRVSDGTYVLGKYGSADSDTWDYQANVWNKIWGLNFYSLPSNTIDQKGKVTYFAYYITEDEVEGFDSSVTPVLDNDGNYTISMTNSYHPESIQLNIDKTWLNKDGELPLLVDRSNQEISFQIYRTENDINIGKAIINGDSSNLIDASELVLLDVKDHGNSVKLASLSGDRIEITVEHISGNNINPEVKIYTVSDPYGNTKASPDESSTVDKKIYYISITKDMTGFEVTDYSGGQYIVSAANNSTSSIQYLLTQEEAVGLNGEPIGDPLVIKGDGTVTTGDLPLVSKGKHYNYYVVESDGDSYRASYVIDGNKVHITNKEPEMLEIDKKWYDSDGKTELEKTDGSITFELHQLQTAIPTVNIKVGDIVYGISGWGQSKKDVSVSEVPTEIKKGSTVTFTVSYEANSNHGNLEGLLADGETITMNDDLVVDFPTTRSYVINNVQNDFVLKGDFKNTSNDANLSISISVQEGQSNGTSDNPDTSTDVSLGSFAVSYDSVEQGSVNSAYPIYAGKNHWTALISNLPKADKNNTYKYYVKENGIAGFISSGDGKDNSVDPDGTIHISNVKEKKGSLEITKEFIGLDFSELTKEQKASLNGISFTITGPDYSKNVSLTEVMKGFVADDLEPGNYTVVENGANDSVPDGFSFIKTTIAVNSSAASDGNTGTATIETNEKITFAFKNTYEELPTSGALTLTKLVTYNGGNPEGTQTESVDGDYIFEVRQKGEEIESPIIKYVLITVSGGKASSYKIADENNDEIFEFIDPIEGSWAVVSGLPEGDYTIAEVSKNGLVLTEAVRGDGNETAVTEDKVVTLHVTAGDPANNPDAAATFTNNYETVNVKVQKIWLDNNDEHGKRPAELHVTLSNNRSVVLSAKNQWSATVTDLPKYDSNGELITYTWTEDTIGNGYSLISTNIDTSDEGGIETIITTLSNGPDENYNPKTTFYVSKTWNDDGTIRPENLTVILYSVSGDTRTEVGRKTIEKPESSEDPNKWNYEFTNVPVFDENGNVIKYVVEEVLPNGYIVSVNEATSHYPDYQRDVDHDEVFVSERNNEQTISTGYNLGFIVIKHGNEFVIWTPRKASEDEIKAIKNMVAGEANRIGDQEFNQILSRGSSNIYGVPNSISKGNMTASIYMDGDNVKVHFGDKKWSQLAWGTLAYTYTSGRTDLINTQVVSDLDFYKEWLDTSNKLIPWDQDITLALKRKTQTGEDASYIKEYQINKNTIPEAPGTHEYTTDDETDPKLILTVSFVDEEPVYHFKIENLKNIEDETEYTYYVREINEQLAGYEVPSYWNVSAPSGSDAAYNHGKIINKQIGGPELPSTGGPGVSIVKTVGLAVMLMTIATFLERKKRK